MCDVMPKFGNVKRRLKRVLFTGADNLSDLDSDAAIATNAKFSEILRNKQTTLGE